MECADEAIALHEQGGTHVWLIDSLRCRGSVLRIAGQRDGARETLRRALRIAVSHDPQLYAADCLANLAAIASEKGRHVEAMRLVGAARASRSHAGAPASHRNPDLDAIEALARSSIGADAVARAQDEGASTSLRNSSDSLPDPKAPLPVDPPSVEARPRSRNDGPRMSA